MLPKQDYYELLALPRTATIAEIKKRYRQLVRKYHPDVAGNNATNARLFAEVTEAYKTLVDPESRRNYDATLINVTQTVYRPSASAQRTTCGPSTGVRQGNNTQVSKLIRDAEMVFIRRRLDQAKTLCKEVIALDRNNARAHVILGDIYRAKHKNEAAVNEYTYAVQLAPNDQQTKKKLEKLLDHMSPIRFSWEANEGRMSNGAIFGNIVGWSLAFFVLFLLNIEHGAPIQWLKTYHVPFITNWSWNLVGSIAGCAAIVGFVLAVNGLIEHPDDELIFERGGQGWAIIPTGLLLLMFGPVFFPAAAAVYLVFAFAQNSISPSVVKVFIAVALIVLMAAAMYPLDKRSVLLVGGDVAFIGALAGWYLGAILRADESILS